MATIDQLLGKFHSIDVTMKSLTDDEDLDWPTKPLHSAHHQQVSEVGDLHQTYIWLNKGEIMANIELLMVAMQEQVLPARQLRTQMYYIRNDSTCTLCKDAPETI